MAYREEMREIQDWKTMVGEHLEEKESDHVGSLSLCKIVMPLFQEQVEDTERF